MSELPTCSTPRPTSMNGMCHAWRLCTDALVPTAVAAALDVHEQRGVPLQELLRTFIGSRDVLLVLDNCEHLVQGAAELAEALLRTCRRLRILDTSRERPGVPVERNWPVPSLAVPDPGCPDRASPGM